MINAGIFDILNQENGPDVDEAFSVMETRLGYSEEESEKILQNFDVFYR